MIRICLLLLLLSACNKKQTRDTSEALAPIERLMEGNSRYVNAHLSHPHQTIQRLREISQAQNPFAAVISCSDSRVPPEIIYDQGLGDLFVIRTAGNVIGDYELASIEYAVLKLNCKVVVITGHEKCGAIQVMIEQENDSLPGHLQNIVDYLKAEPGNAEILKNGLDRNYQVVIQNIIYGVDLIRSNSSIIRERFEKGELEIYGAIYHVDTGKIQIIEDVVAHK